MVQKATCAKDKMRGISKRLSPRYQEIAPMVISAYKEQRSIRKIIKTFLILPITIIYKILTDNYSLLQVYEKLNDDQIN